MIGTPAILSRPNPTAGQEGDSALDELLGLPARTGGSSADELLGLPDEDVASAAAATASAALSSTTTNANTILTKRKISDLISELDSNEKLTGPVEDLLLELADEFIDSVTSMACRLAKHRRADRVEVRDVQLHLERNWNLRVPFPGSVPIAPPRVKVGAGGGGGAGAGAGGGGGGGGQK